MGLARNAEELLNDGLGVAVRAHGLTSVQSMIGFQVASVHSIALGQA